MNIMQKEWADYCKKVYPDGLHAIQNRECHQAFFAGAFVVVAEIAKAVELPNDQAMR